MDDGKRGALAKCCMHLVLGIDAQQYTAYPSDGYLQTMVPFFSERTRALEQWRARTAVGKFHYLATAKFRWSKEWTADPRLITQRDLKRCGSTVKP